MKTSVRRRTMRPLAAVALAVVGSILAPAAALGRCSTPVAEPGADTYSRDGVEYYSAADKAVISWDAGSSGGFLVEWSTSPSIDTDTGSFATIAGKAEPGASARQKLVKNLEEREYYYHVQAKPKSGVCERSFWSNPPVKITQDKTNPTAEFTTKPRPISPTPVAPPVPTFVNQPFVRLEGRAADPVALSADSSSGPLLVVVTLQNSTPVLGGAEPIERTVFVDTDNSWLADFANVPLGVYTASAVAIDLVGNQAATAATLTFVVVDS